LAGQAWSDQAYLGSALQPAHAQRWTNQFLHVITPLTTGLACLAILAIGTVRRLPLAGVVAALGLGLAAAMAELLRIALPHPDLATGYEALMGDKAYQTFPSGHATIVTATTLGLLLVASRQWRLPIAIGGTLAVTLVAVGTVAAHWHRPGDALGGIALACLVQGMAAIVLVRRYGQPVASPKVTVILAAGCAATSVLGMAWYLSDVRLARVDQLPVGVPLWAFPIAITAIGIAAGIAVYAFARLLRDVDLVPRGVA
jgi:membrane-associated phospholipid phosphatase